MDNNHRHKTLEKKGAERKANLKKRIEAYNTITGSDNPSSER